MAFRRLPVTMALGLVVAVGAHLAVFGTSHAMGGTRGSGLLAALPAFLTLLGILGVLWIGLGTRRLGERRAIALLHGWLPGGGRANGEAIALILGGACAFAGAEALEGHTLFGSFPALLALPIVAVIVAILARAVTRWLAWTGLKLAAFAGDLHLSALPIVGIVTVFAAPTLRRELAFNRWGRAPPLQA